MSDDFLPSVEGCLRRTASVTVGSQRMCFVSDLCSEAADQVRSAKRD